MSAAGLLARLHVTRSLAGRVALASALAAALGGTTAALSTGLVAKELVAKQEQKTVRAEAKELAKEVLEELDDDIEEHREALAEQGYTQRVVDGQDLLLDRILLHELGDVKLHGARAVIRDRDGVIAGDAHLPQPARGDCSLSMLTGIPVRACSVAIGNRTLTLVALAQDERERSGLIWQALWVGLSLGALLGGVVSFFLSRWALAPLLGLRDRVRAMPSDDPQAARLGGVSAQLEVEQLRAAIASLVERLGAALKQAQSFAAEAAHELRTPLTTIGGELELLVEGTGGAGDTQALARVHRQVLGLTDLVQRLLVLAQPGRLDDARAELVDLADVAEAALAAFSPTQRARVDVRCADDVIVRGDPALLRALLVNALDNALKFSADEVELVLANTAGRAQLDVIDRGPGIAAADRTQVFQPFYRAASVRAGGAGGHGIGLALIARVVWAHGGEVTLEDSPRGAHLRVRLPRWNAPKPASNAV